MANLSGRAAAGEVKLFSNKSLAATSPTDKEPAGPASGTLGRVLHNAGWLLAGKGFGALLSIVYIGIATRTLGPEGFGHFVLVLGTGQLISSFVSFQSWQAMVRYGIQHLGSEDRRPLSRLVGFCLALDIAGSAIGCVLAIAFVQLAGPSFGWTPELRWEALLFCLVLLLSIRSAAVGLLRLYDRFAKGAAADAVIPLVRLIGALLALFIDPTVRSFLIAWAASDIAAALVHWILASRTEGWSLREVTLKDIRGVPAEYPGLWHFVGITNAASSLVLVSTQLTVLLVGMVVGPAAAGGYRLAHQLGQALAKISETLSRAAFAELSRAHASGVQEQLATLFRNTFWFALGAGSAIAVLLLLLGKPVLHLIAGPAFAGAYPLLLLLGFAATLDMIGISFEPALLATGRAGLALRLRLFTTVVLLALLAVLLPMYGAIGAATAALAASAAGLCLSGVITWRAVHKVEQS